MLCLVPNEARGDGTRDACAFEIPDGSATEVVRDTTRTCPDTTSQSSNGPTMSRKPGRNDPCPCGSGRKFKKCCLAQTRPLPDAVVARMNERVRQHMLEEAERKRRFGEVRPLITTVHKGHRFIVVGSWT